SIEPPSWWARSSIEPLRLLVRGRGLAVARVAGDGGLAFGPPSVNAAGTALLVDLSLVRATPGVHTVRIDAGAAHVSRAWELAPPLERAGRFAGFSPDDVLYLLMPDRFADGDPSNDDPPASRGLFDRADARYYHGGDFQGVIDHLPYLADLGVTALWMTPIHDNANRLNTHEEHGGRPVTDYHGYGAVDLYGVEEHFGDLAKLRELVARAHAFGIRVIQDEVANHTGPEHPWAHDPPTADWLHGTPEHHLPIELHASSIADPRADPAVKRRVLDGWFVDLLPDVAQENEEPARYEIQNTLWWIATAGFDGIRQDTLPYVPRAFWARWMEAIRREFPDVRVVGEMNDPDARLVSFFQGGRARFDGVDSRIDTLFDFPLVYPLRRVFAQGASMKELAVAFETDSLYVDPSVLVTFAGLHDMKRFMSEPGATTERFALAQTLLLTARGTPMIYYGDEIGTRGGDDPDNRRDFPGGFPGDVRNAFTEAGRTAEEQDLFARVRKVARARRALAPLRRGRMVMLAAEDRAMAYARVPPDGAGVVVVLHDGAREAVVTCDVARASLPRDATLVDALGAAPDVHLEGTTLRARMPPRSAAIYTLRAQ
ncbi:MAG TPA: alpha-amylase family glycosyl hydrolase, partial [Labilithrix sp.]